MPIDIPYFSGSGVGINLVMQIVMWLGIIALIVVSVLAIWLIGFKFIRYKIRVNVYRKIGDTFKKIVDRGGVLKYKHGSFFKLLKMRQVMPVPDYSYFVVGNKGKTELNLIQVGTDEFYPAKFKINTKGNPEYSLGLNPQQKDMLAWNFYAKELLRSKFDIKGIWEKYGSVISMAFVGAIVLIILGMAFKNWEGVASAFAQASKDLAAAARSLEPAAQGSGILGGGAP